MEQNPNFAYTLKQTSQFKKDLKSVKFDDNKLNELQIVLEHLGRTGEVPAEYLPQQRAERDWEKDRIGLPKACMDDDPHDRKCSDDPADRTPWLVRLCPLERAGAPERKAREEEAGNDQKKKRMTGVNPRQRSFRGL